MDFRSVVLACLVFQSSAALEAAGPVGSWDFTTKADVVRDLSGHGNDLRIEGCEWMASKVGQALYIPRKGARVWCEKPNSQLGPSRAVSIVAWVRAIKQGTYRGIVDHGRGWGDANKGYRLMFYGNGMRFMVQGDQPVNLTGGETLMGQWHQVAATYDGQSAAVFLDGREVRRVPLTGPIDYRGVEGKFIIGANENGGLGGEIAWLKVFDCALSQTEVAADFEAGRKIRLTTEELGEFLYAGAEKCALVAVPDAPFVRDRHTTLLAHMDAPDHADAEYARWDGRAGGGEMKHAAPGRFGSAVELLGEGAPILYRGAGNCSMQRGTCEFWMKMPDDLDVSADDDDRYLLTILPEWHIGYGDRPSVHLCLRGHAASKTLQLAAHTGRIGWYSHLNGRTICDTAQTVLRIPLRTVTSPGWHHVLCSWTLDEKGRVWLIVDGQGVTAELDRDPSSLPAIPCYKVFLGGSYFPDVYCPTARAVFDEFRLLDLPVTHRLSGAQALQPLPSEVDENLMMHAEDICRHLLDFTAKLQMGGGWEGLYTWPNLMPDESPGSYAAAAEDEYTMRYIIPAFLRAYEVLGEDRYLRVAEKCGQMLVKTQDANGAWCQGYIVMPDGYHAVSPGGGDIQEGTQTDPLRLLSWLWRLTKRQEYFDAAIKSAEFVRAAQLPCGAWPLSFNSHTMQPAGGYSGLPTLNDGATVWGMKAMIMGWHLTDEEEYLEALRKAGDWLVAAQIKGPGAAGWAEQYGADGKPAWARRFEPPMVCLTAVTYAVEGLLLMYDLTGETKYLQPLRECVTWGRGLPDEKKTYLYYDPQDGQPVVSADHKILKLGEPGFDEHSRYRTSADYFDRIAARLKARDEHGPLAPCLWVAPSVHATGATDFERQVATSRLQGWSTMCARSVFEQQPLTREQVIGQLKPVESAIAGHVADLDAFALGRFPAGLILNTHRRHGRCFWPGKGAIAALPVLDYLHYAKVAAGDMPLATVPRMTDGYFGHIDPKRDWYKTTFPK